MCVAYVHWVCRLSSWFSDLCTRQTDWKEGGGGVSLYNREQSADEARLSSEMVLNCKPSNIPTTNFDSKLLEGADTPRFLVQQWEHAPEHVRVMINIPLSCFT